MDLQSIMDKKARLDRHRPLPPELVRNLEEWFRVELTYTSNAIEGNTLTRAETAMVVEKGITVGGKTLVEHLEAANHAQALDWLKTQVSRPPESLTERDVLKLHEMILKGIDDASAGRYRGVAVRISGSLTVLPNPRKVPDLMDTFGQWLSREAPRMHPVEAAFEAHLRLVTIHPFIDGNGRTARLLMNLMLLMAGYPAALIGPEQRLAYLTSLERAQTEGDSEPYQKVMAEAVERSLDIYLEAVEA